MSSVVEQFIGEAVSSDIARLTERASKTVVEIRSPHGAGAGVIWAASGLVVTNRHVVPGEQATVVLPDGRSARAAVTGRDPVWDVAALHVPLTDLTPAAVGDSTQLRAGQIVVAVGHPYGLNHAATLGFIASRPADPNAPLRWSSAVHSALMLRPGNSGGPLLNAEGQVIAVNSMITGPRQAVSIPTHAIETFLSRLHRRPLLGVTVQAAAAVRAATRETIAGLLVTQVRDESAADSAGILPGDLLTFARVGSLERRLVEPGDLAWVLSQGSRGASVDLGLLRGGRSQVLTFRLGSNE